MYYYTHASSLTAFCVSPFKRGQRGCHHNRYLIADLVHESRLSGLVSHYREPGRFTEVDPDDVCVVRKPVSDEPFSHLATRPQTYQKSELLRHLDIEGDELVS